MEYHAASAVVMPPDGQVSECLREQAQGQFAKMIDIITRRGDASLHMYSTVCAAQYV